MSRPTAVIAEDEPCCAPSCARVLAALWPELAIVREAEDGIAALRARDGTSRSILFLDIEMPGMTGLEVARAASGKCHVVFVTAYDKYAVAAFEQGAVDYVMKPFSTARLATTVHRLKERVAPAGRPRRPAPPRSAQREPGPQAYLRWITASQGQNVRLITVDEVLYFRADSKYTLVVTADGEALIRTSITELADELDPEAFWQIHRGTLVNVNASPACTASAAARSSCG